MQPRIELVSPILIAEILDEAFGLLQDPGVKVVAPEARRLLAEAGARVDSQSEVVSIPERLVRATLETVPAEFWLYDLVGQPVVHYGGNSVQFDPGSSGVNILDPETLEHRPARTADLLKLIKLAELLPQYAAQSTAVVCHDVPEQIGDLYRLYLVLLHSVKPVVTGAFSVPGTTRMAEMLVITAGGVTALAEKPRAIFDVCPSPPLNWTNFASQNLIDLARAGIPAEIVSMPLAGAAAPVTLLGSLVQHAAECLSGITIHQLARPGAPIVWGGAPAIFDMRHGTTPMGATETAMIDIAYAQVGKSLNIPTHAYLGASDAKLVDTQAGLESGVTALLGALGGINMISGAGMLDFLACQSPEKLVIDAEIIAMSQRLLRGIERHTDSLAREMFDGFAFRGDFLKQKVTRQLFAREQHLPSMVIDRGSLRAWEENGRQSTFARARERVQQLLSQYQPPELPAGMAQELADLVGAWARKAGMDQLPELQPIGA